VDELEAEIAQLKNQNSHLTNQVGHLSDENKGLKEELQQLHTLVKKTGLSGAWDFKQTASEVPQKIKTAGVCLLIIMFSFGLFFGNGPAVQPFLQNGYRRADIPQVLPTASLISSKVGMPPRRILEVDPPLSNKPIAERIPKPTQQNHITINDKPTTSSKSFLTSASSTSSGSTATSSSGSTATSSVSPSTKSTSASVATSASSASPPMKRKFGSIQQEDEEVRTNIMAEFMNESSPSNISHLSENSEVVHFFSEKLKQQPNTVFFTSSDFQQIVPSPLPHYDPESPFFLSLLVPARTLHPGANLSSKDTTEDTAIEISCQIVGINYTNFEIPPLTASA